jgi:small multidrug resistance pump
MLDPVLTSRRRGRAVAQALSPAAMPAGMAAGQRTGAGPDRRASTGSSPGPPHPSSPMPYLALFLAILAEAIGTAALQACEQFTRPLPSLAALLGYGLAFYLLSVTLRSMNVGIVYAIWSGVGIVLIALIGRFAFGQRLDLPALLGIGLILAGVLVIHLFSATATR